MRRFWIDKNFFSKDLVVIQGEDFHHICEVCRLDLEAKFYILSEGKSYLGQIIEKNKKNAIFKIISEEKIKDIPEPWIHLCLSMPKVPTFESILEKSVEMGVYKVHPFISDFSFIRKKNDPKISEKSERWNKIIKSATQQSGRGTLMQLSEVSEASFLINEMNQKPNQMGLFLYEGKTSLNLYGELRNKKYEKPKEIWVFIGSEGGFSSQEVSYFSEKRLQPLTLGDQVLRVETACISVLSILKYEFNLSQQVKSD